MRPASAAATAEELLIPPVLRETTTGPRYPAGSCRTAYQRVAAAAFSASRPGALPCLLSATTGESETTPALSFSAPPFLSIATSKEETSSPLTGSELDSSSRTRPSSEAPTSASTSAARGTFDDDLLDATLDAALDDYGKELVGALGSEIDRIEASIRAFMPSIRHIDLEADKGSAGEVRHSLRDPL